MVLRRHILAALSAAALIVAVQPSHAALDNKGKEFVMAFLRGLTSPTLELHLTADVATTVSVEYPLGTPLTNVPVAPGVVTIVSIPTSAHNWTWGLVEARAIRATAPEEFVCYMVNRETYTSDAALALPLETFNTEFIVATYTALNGSDSQFGVVAGYDNTTVTITPKVLLSSGQPADVPFTVTLNKGQGFVVSGYYAGSAGDLTGSIVTSDKPIGMANGNVCTFIPPGVWACDHIFEVAQPTQTWGKRALVANLPNRTGGTVYRILASQNGTAVTEDGVGIGTIDRGQFIEVGPVAGSHVFESTNPIFVVQYMTGDENPGATLGDPAMANIAPTEQYLAGYTFSTVGGGQFVENYVSIIANDADVGTMTLDGTPIPVGQFTPIDATGFSSAVLALSSGTHSTASVHGHGITVEGYNDWDSYMYPGGALFQFINPVGDANAPVCGELAADGFCVSATATDNRPTEDVNGNGVLDEGEDLNGNGQIDVDAGIFFIELDATSTNLTLTTEAFTPGDDEVDYQVCLTDNTIDGSGYVVVTDGAGNTCSTAITIVANQPPVIVCKDEPVPFDADENCQAAVAPEDLVTSVSDPDDGPGEQSWTLSMSPEGPFTTGTHEVTVTATDDKGASASCTAEVVVSDVTAPTITLAPNVSQHTPDHSMFTFSVNDIVASISDNCDALAPADAVITMATSDEAEDAVGTGDGNTHDDIVIAADCKSVDLRGERNGTGNGRVYRVFVSVTDGSGNTASAVFRVGIRRSNNGDEAVLDPTQYSVTSSCATAGKPSIFVRDDHGSISIEAVNPNPFDASTTITYMLAKPGRTTLVVRDVSGKPVATLVDEELAAGTHTARLLSEGLPNGSYFITLECNGVTATHHVTLLR